jgi:esterase/lipase superfamily enzyme
MRGGGIAGGYLVRPRPGLTGILILVGFAIGGCSSRPSSSVLVPITAAAGGGKSVSILAATTRTRSHDDDEAFTNGRARTVNYEQYAISIPPDHVSGQIEWPAQIPGNPERDFVVTSAQQLDVNAFTKAIARRLESKGSERGNVLVFVHGYNTNYQEAVFRLAQLDADGGFGGPAVVFAWPSRGTLVGYVADRESSTYSRDYLEQVLDELARIPGVRSINLVAHSMGNWLAWKPCVRPNFADDLPFSENSTKWCSYLPISTSMSSGRSST